MAGLDYPQPAKLRNGNQEVQKEIDRKHDPCKPRTFALSDPTHSNTRNSYCDEYSEHPVLWNVPLYCVSKGWVLYSYQYNGNHNERDD
jgi:hypothetical protein